MTINTDKKQTSTHGFSAMLVILKKEIIDNLRDRRTLTTLALSIVMSPLFIIGIQWFTEGKIKSETDPITAKSFELPVDGAQYAPNLMNWLKQKNIAIIDAPNDPEQAIKSGERRVIMVIKENFSERFNDGQMAPIKLIHDSSISGLETIGMKTVESAVRSYSAQISKLRLQARGIDPTSVMQPIYINKSDVATPESRNSQILSLFPYLTIMMIMFGGMYLAIDSTAGEREKGSLESLLTLPVKRSHVLLAKLLATAFFSGLTFFLAMMGFALILAYAPLESVDIAIEPIRVIYVFVVCLPFVFVGSSLLILVASFTKSYKEAQSYLGFITILPTMPLLFLMLLSPEASVSNMWVPSLSQALIMIETFKGETIAAPLIALSMGSSLLLAVVLSAIAIKLYQREEILG